MGVVFADAGYWIALWNPRDALHQQAMAFAEVLGASDVVPRNRCWLKRSTPWPASVGFGGPSQRSGLRSLRPTLASLRGTHLEFLDSPQQSVSHFIKLNPQHCGCIRLARKRRMISHPDGVTPDPLELATKL